MTALQGGCAMEQQAMRSNRVHPRVMATTAITHPQPHPPHLTKTNQPQYQRREVDTEQLYSQGVKLCTYLSQVMITFEGNVVVLAVQ